VLDHYGEGDVVEGRVTKVVTFGAFVEILPGVEGLVHISELANHHVENPREVVSQGDPVNVLVLEIDGDRRRLSLSLKRVEEGAVPVPRADGGDSVHSMPDLRLSEEAFPSSGAVVDDMEPVAGSEDEIVEGSLVVEEAEDAAQPAVEADAEPEAEPDAEPAAEVDAEPTVDAEPEPEPEPAAVADAELAVEPDAEPTAEADLEPETAADAADEPEPEADAD
jgi:small subunit ribosomal protein S1